MKAFRTILIVMVAAAGLWFDAAAMPAYAAIPGGGSCWTSQQIQSAIAQGQIQSWAKIRRLAGISDDLYETSPVRVCLKGGIPYFIVNLSSPKGENVQIVLNAVDGGR